MISGFVKGQELTLTSPIIASGTVDYLSATFIFFTNEWKDLDEIWVHFQKGDQIYDAKVVNGKVDKSEHINLDNGEWSVYLHGNQFVNGEVVQRITTERQKLFVKESGVLNGEVFPSVNASTSEIFLAKANYAVDLAEKLRQDLENGQYSYTLTDEDINNIVNITLRNIEENSSYVSSVTAFPETAAEGDVVLLHRCNEISVDDSNSGVVLDTAAMASLTLPEGTTDRIWEFNAVNPSGIGFSLTLEQRVIEEAEPYVLTGIFLLSENYGGRWYWRDGQPYDGIPNASADPLPEYIPLGRVENFTATKDPLIDENFDEHEDTDNTTIFRTVPREYMYSGGEWKLTERTDIAEGNLISDFGKIEKDGQKFYRLDLTDSRSLKNRKKKAVDIPIEDVKKTTTTVGGITLESEEIVFPNVDISDYFETTAENEEPIYSEELAISNGWIADGWSGDFAKGFTHTTGNTTPLIFTMPEDTAQNTYRISFRCSESIAVEALMVRCGGSELFDLYGQAYDPVVLGIVSVENGNLEFVPASTFKGTITDISIKRVTGFNPTKQTITDSTGEISCEMRTTKSSLDNVFIGKHSGENNISGRGCSAVGSLALQNNTSGFWNVGVGHNALRDNTVGSRNVGIGYIALAENVTGIRNIAIGSYALNHNKTGNKNIAIGADALDKNVDGSQNVAIGLQALYQNVSGNYNTAIGVSSLGHSTSDNNTAVGYLALDHCTTGNTNIALGYCAGAGITTGSSNFALGANSLYKMKTGSNNIAIGVQAGRGQGTTAGFKHGIFIGANTGYALCNNADYNVLIGCNAGKAITTGTYNILLGDNIETPTPTTSHWVNIGGLYEGSRNTADKYAKINGGLQLSDIPKTDPAIVGRVWNDNGTLKVSAG